MKFIKDRYKDASFEIQLKAPMLFKILTTLALLFVILVIFDIVAKIALVRLFLHIFIMMFCGGGAYLISIGKYELCVKIFFITVTAAMGGLRLAEGYLDIASMSLTVSVLGSFMIMSALFIQNRKTIMGMCVFIGGSSVYVLYRSIVSGDIQNGLLTVNHLAFPTVSMVAIIFGVITSRNIYDYILKKILKNMSEIEEKRNQQKNIILSSAEQMNKSEILLNNSTETASAAMEIERNVVTINDNVNGLDNKIKSTSEILLSLSDSVEDMRNSIKAQTDKVTNSTNAIEGIVASINSVGETIDKEEASVQLLREKSRGGEKIVNDTANAFVQLTSQMDNIHGMTKMISKIAAQTNLLAMNAAIEAAHAGDKGKGFSVVAYEIRELANSSSVNAKEITTQLKELISSIEDANVKVDSTGSSFRDISKEIEQVSKAMVKIKNNTVELSRSGRDVLSSSLSLISSTNEINGKIERINTSHTEMVNDVHSLEGVSSQITWGMNEISQGVTMISESVQTIHNLSEELKEHGECLDKDISEL